MRRGILEEIPDRLDVVFVGDPVDVAEEFVFGAAARVMDEPVDEAESRIEVVLPAPDGAADEVVEPVQGDGEFAFEEGLEDHTAAHPKGPKVGEVSDAALVIVAQSVGRSGSFVVFGAVRVGHLPVDGGGGEAKEPSGGTSRPARSALCASDSCGGLQSASHR